VGRRGCPPPPYRAFLITWFGQLTWGPTRIVQVWLQARGHGDQLRKRRLDLDLRQRAVAQNSACTSPPQELGTERRSKRALRHLPAQVSFVDCSPVNAAQDSLPIPQQLKALPASTDRHRRPWRPVWGSMRAPCGAGSGQTRRPIRTARPESELSRALQPRQAVGCGGTRRENGRWRSKP
jgi:hypothetical protein